MRPFVLLLLFAAASAAAQPAAPLLVPQVGAPVAPVRSPSLRTLPVLSPVVESRPRIIPRNRGGHFSQGHPGVRPADPLAGPTRGPSPDVTVETFLGMSRAGGGNFFVPPDVIGDIGPDHYVQMVNGGLAVYARDGSVLLGPVRLSTLWAGVPGPCNGDAGDPVVTYDELADRWLLAQFASGNGLCVAVSSTPDPTGEYALYAFSTPSFPDYPKISVWPDAYYAGINSDGATVLAMDREAMLADTPAATVLFNLNRNYLLPADVDGPTPPAPGTPGLFYTFMDQEFWTPEGIPGPDRLELWSFDVNWTAPDSSTFALTTTLPTAPFNYTVCGFFNFNCASQPGTGQRLDVVSEWPMWRFAYRNFGRYETLVGSFAVDVTGSGQAGVRWFELRTDLGAWTLRQEGTLAPDTDHRFMSSAAMNADGDLAVAYSVSSSVTFPSLRFALRLADDPLGQLRPEVSFVAGAGSQTGLNRYGDYAALSVDPADGRTFWYTGEYYTATSGSEWSTRIGSFVIETPTAAEEAPAVGTAGLRVRGPFPNPVARTASASLTLTVERAQHVRIDVVGVLGQQLATLHDGPLPAGERQLMVPTGLAPGMYLVRVRGDDGAVVTRRLLVAR